MSNNIKMPWLQEEEPQENAHQWMLTFADMISLLLTFFVLLYSMSSVPKAEWDQIHASLAQVLNPKESMSKSGPSEQLGIDRIQITKLQTLEYMYSLLKQDIQQNPALRANLDITLLDDRLAVSLISPDNFNGDGVELNQNTLEVLDILGDLLRSIGNQIEVYGNTSTDALNNTNYPSNWERSTARALVVAERLRNRGYDYKIISYGRADTNFVGIRSVNAEKRDKLAQRIDIIIRDYRGLYP